MTKKDKIYLEMSEQEALMKEALKKEKLRLEQSDNSVSARSYTEAQTRKRQEFSL